MPINPNAPFARIIADIPTEIALLLEKSEVRGGKSKKQFIADAIVAAVNASAPTQTAAPAKRTKK